MAEGRRACDIACSTHPGQVRTINCDRCRVADAQALGGKADAFLMVVDGMGVTRRGDTASRVAAEVVPEVLHSAIAALPAQPTCDQLADALREAVSAANLAVWKRAQEDPELKGMGTTCVAALVTGGTALVCHAGDSRAYKLSGDDLIQITADHSLIQEVVPSDDFGVSVEDRFGAVITRGIGLSRSVETDLEVVKLEAQDALLLCTDGLSNMLDDRRIAATLAQASSAGEACEKLIGVANEAGGLDNIGVAVFRGPEYEPYAITAEAADRAVARARGSRTRRRRSRSPWTQPMVIVLLVICVVLSAALALTLADRARLLSDLNRARSASMESASPGR